jgi:MFS family permease
LLSNGQGELQPSQKVFLAKNHRNGQDAGACNNYLCSALFSYSTNFWRLCFSMFFFTASCNLIIPELNDFITALGGKDLKGLVIGLFTISAGIARPFSGKLADHIGRRKVLFIGISIAILISFLYPLSATVSVWFFLLLRFLHGFSMGFYPTGATALVTDILPAKVRGSGMGLWGTFISLGIGAGMALSSQTVHFLGLNGLFFVSALFGLVSLILLVRVEETLKNVEPFKPAHLLVRPDEIIERNVIPVAIVMFLSATCSGTVFVLASDIAKSLHIPDKGWFFMWYVVSTIGIRLFAGQLSDRIGRRETLLIGMIVLTASMFIIGCTTTKLWFTLSAVLFGVATGIGSPTIFAWTADLSPANRRGIGAGTMFIALEFGILTGSLVTNMIYTNRFSSVFSVFLFAACMAFLCVLYVCWHLWRRDSKT